MPPVSRRERELFPLNPGRPVKHERKPTFEPAL